MMKRKNKNLKTNCHAELDSASILRCSMTFGSRNKFGMTDGVVFLMAQWGMTALMLLALFFTTPTWAAITYDETAGTCAGGSGKMFIGVDGEKYCRSNVTMNWWSAFAWCEGAGGKLIPLDRCNGKNGDITGNVACPNFNGKNTFDCWTSSVSSSSQGYCFSSGAVNPSAGRNGNRFTLCE